MRHAAALAGAAIMARSAAIQGFSEIRAPRGHDGAPKFFFDAIAEQSFLAGQRNGRLKVAVGKMFEALGTAGDSNVLFDKIVVRLNVFVAERPVFAIAIERSTFEVPIAKAQADTAPHVRTASGNTKAPHPVEWLIRRSSVGLFKIVDEPIVGVFVADAKFNLNGPRLADEFWSHIAVLEFEWWLVLGKIRVGLRATGFQEGDFKASFRETLARPAAGSAGTDDDNIERTVRLVRHTFAEKTGC